jgi:hypothetical protein
MKFSVFLLALAFPISCIAQRDIQEKVYSTFLKDTVRYHVTVPENWDKSQACPVLYTFKYGMVDGPYIASQLRYFKTASYFIPNTIVVTILADMDRIGLVYETGLLTNTGKNLASCLRNEIIPNVKAKYHTSFFKTYLGHSYSASYANYLFQNEPDIFNGYILLAAEKTGADYSKPSPFVIDKKLVEFYEHRNTFYYAAVGEHDLQRRHTYVREIEKKVGVLDSNHFFFKYDSIPGGDHTNILTLAIQPALEHIYLRYNPGMTAGVANDAWTNFTENQKYIEKTYGILAEKGNRWYGPYAQMALRDKDTTALLKIAEYVGSEKARASDIRNLGDHLASAGLKGKAMEYYERTIKSIETSTGKADWQIFVLGDCYLNIATKIFEKEPRKGWIYLLKGLKLAEVKGESGAQNIDAYFRAGKYAIDNNYKIKDGIDFLLHFASLRTKTIDEIHWSYERTYLILAKGYYALKDIENTKWYLQKVLMINADNKEAKEMLGKI